MAIGSVMSLDVPAGWQVIRQPPFTSTQQGSDGQVCLHQPGDTHAVFGCAGIAIYYGIHLPGAHTNPYAPDRPDGWYPATDVQQCPYGPAQVDGQLNGIETKPGLSKGLRPVGRHRADWNRWTATCVRGEYFHPQAWFLPQSRVVIFDYVGHPETTAVLASARFAADGDALPAMPAYLSAHLVSQSGYSMSVQPFTTYGNDAAGKAYAKAHKLPYPFLDDHLDVDMGSVRTITLTVNTACLGNIVLTGQNADDLPVPCSAYTGHKDLTMGFWVHGGTAESVTELYRP
ncbi:MAG: hypothetical protein JWR52_1289 [Marmoricola sp.]|nr:hypothetical protein [Marmoricola sp.]